MNNSQDYPRYLPEVFPESPDGSSERIEVRSARRAISLDRRDYRLLEACNGWRDEHELGALLDDTAAGIADGVAMLRDQGLVEPRIKQRRVLLRQDMTGDYRGLFAVLNTTWATQYLLDRTMATEVELLDTGRDYWARLFQPLRNLLAPGAAETVIRPARHEVLNTDVPELLRSESDLSLVPQRIAPWPTGRAFQRFLGDPTTRRRIHRVLDAYVRPAVPIRDAVDRFVAEHIGDGPVIGAHLRATNHIGLDVGPKRYVDEVVVPEIEAHAERFGWSDCQVLVATHVEPYLERCRERLGDRCISRAIARNDDPGVRFNEIQVSIHEKSRDVLIDCLLLARCDALLGIPSNVLLTALMLNPDSPLKIFDIALDRKEKWRDPERSAWASPRIEG